jgi:VWFA-related protein
VKTAFALSRAAVVAVGLASVLAAAGQQAPTVAPRQRPTFRAGTNYVRVDVYPTVDGRIVNDLGAGDFELREDGVVQKLEAVEFVDPGPTVPEAVRVEPNTPQQALDAALDPRARLFVIFIDTYHLQWTSGYRAYLAFADMLGRQIGERDMVALMTPEMSVTALTFGRRTKVIEEVLQRHFDITRSGNGVNLDDDDNWYAACYGDPSTSEIARKMIERRHEKITLDALRDLSRYLGALRDERKAVFMVSDGWVPTKPDEGLAKVPESGQPPGPPPIGVGPDGRIRVGTAGAKQQGGDNQYLCDKDRMRLAREDHESEFRRMLDEANRAAVSFYVVDLRGLTVSEPPGRWMLRDMSSATDGLAIVNENDAAAGVRRAMDDMRGYYLLGYYSTNPKSDGRFRSIKVTVRRPRVQVRARRGYVAPTEEELKAAAAASESRAAPSAGAKPVESAGAASPHAGNVDAVTAAGALDALSRVRNNVAVRTLAGASWQPAADGATKPVVWIASEFDSVMASRDSRWEDGAEVSVELSGPDGAPPTAASRVTRSLDRDSRFVFLRLPEAGLLAPGAYTLRVIAKPTGAMVGNTESLTVMVPGAATGAEPLGQPVLSRRGPFSGSGWMPTADVRYHRQERLKIEIAATGEVSAGVVKLLDRAGHQLPLPVLPGLEVQGGVTTVSGEVTLAPLGPGDYLIEASITRGGRTDTRLVAFRIIP